MVFGAFGRSAPAAAAAAASPVVVPVEREKEKPDPTLRGPIGSFVNQGPQIALDFQTEWTRLRREIPKAKQLEERLLVLQRVLRKLSSEGKLSTPELDKEWEEQKACWRDLQASVDDAALEILGRHERHTLAEWMRPILAPSTESTKETMTRLFFVTMLHQQLNQNGILYTGHNRDIQKGCGELRAHLSRIARLKESVAAQITVLKGSDSTLFPYTVCSQEIAAVNLSNPQLDRQRQEIGENLQAAQGAWKAAYDHLSELRQAVNRVCERLHNADSSEVLAQLDTAKCLKSLSDRRTSCQKLMGDPRQTKMEELLTLLGSSHPALLRASQEMATEVDLRLYCLELQIQETRQAYDRLAALPAKKAEDRAPEALKLAVTALEKPVGSDQKSWIAAIAAFFAKFRSQAPKGELPSVDWNNLPVIAPQEFFKTLLPATLILPEGEGLAPPAAAGEPESTIQQWERTMKTTWPAAVTFLEAGLTQQAMRLVTRWQFLQRVSKAKLKPEWKPYIRELYWQLRADCLAAKAQRAGLAQTYQSLEASLKEAIVRLDKASALGVVSGLQGTTSRIADAKNWINHMPKALAQLKTLHALLEGEWKVAQKLDALSTWLEGNDRTRLLGEDKPPDPLPALERKPEPEYLHFHLAIAELSKGMVSPDQFLSTPSSTRAFKVAMERLEDNKFLQQELNFRRVSSCLDTIVIQMVQLVSNIGYLADRASAIASLYHPLPMPLDATSEEQRGQLMALKAAHSAILQDIQTQESLISNIIAQLKATTDKLEKKVSAEKMRWRGQQAEWMLRTPAGNESRLQQLQRGISKLHFIIGQLEELRNMVPETYEPAHETIHKLHLQQTGLKGMLGVYSHFPSIPHAFKASASKPSLQMQPVDSLRADTEPELALTVLSDPDWSRLDPAAAAASAGEEQ